MICNYIALGNRYWRLHGEESFQPSESHLYWCLLNEFSSKGKRDDWPESIKMTDGAWATAASVNVKTIDKTRKKLEARGLILSQSTGQGARFGRTYWLVNEAGTYPESYPKNGEVQGEVSKPTSPKNGEVKPQLLPELLQQPLQNPTQKMEKSYIYSEYQTGNRETQTLNYQQQNAPDVAVDEAGGTDADRIVELDAKKKQEQAPPQPLPSEQDVREELAESDAHWKHAFERRKLVQRHEQYLDLIEDFIGQQKMKAEKGKPIFPELHKVRHHFMNWLNRLEEVKQQKNGSNNPTKSANGRTANNLRPTSIGQPDYRGKGSDCNVDL